MKKLFKEIINELIFVLKGKTLDTIIPPLIFIISINFLNLNYSLLLALSFSLALFILRLIKKETGKYALFGIIGILFASIFAYINQNATNYFISDMIGNVLIVIISIYTLIIDKPLAAYASHLTRGWPIAWFLRDDVKPAYREVTYFWTIVFLIRGIVELRLYLDESINALFIVNTIVGLPLLIAILTISYIYGIWRLRTLKGPSVDEFLEGKKAPYKGQTKGF